MAKTKSARPLSVASLQASVASSATVLDGQIIPPGTPEGSSTDGTAVVLSSGLNSQASEQPVSGEQDTGTNTQGDDADAANSGKPGSEIPEPALTVATAAANPEVVASTSGTSSSDDPAAGYAQELFERDYPLLAAELEAWGWLAGGPAPVLRIKAKQAGFRRGGLAHPTEAVDHDLQAFSPAQIEAILGEPMLVAELV
ncbi:hypothetical protein ACXHXM_02005